MRSGKPRAHGVDRISPAEGEKRRPYTQLDENHVPAVLNEEVPSVQAENGDEAADLSQPRLQAYEKQEVHRPTEGEADHRLVRE